MKRNTKNEKVLRAITIGLATMIAATSAPITAMANPFEDGVGHHDGNDQGGDDVTPAPSAEETAPVEVNDENISAAQDMAEELVSAPAEEAPAPVESAPAETPAPVETAPAEASAPVETAPAEASAPVETALAEASAPAAETPAPEASAPAAETPAPEASAPALVTEAAPAAEAAPVAEAQGLIPNAITAVETAFPEAAKAVEEGKTTGKETVDTAVAVISDLNKGAEMVAETAQDLKNLEQALQDANETKITPFAYVGDKDDAEGEDTLVIPSEITADSDGNVTGTIITDENGKPQTNEDGTVKLENKADNLMFESVYESYSEAIEYINDGDTDNAKVAAANAQKKLDAEQAKVDNLKEAIKDSKAAEDAVAAAQEKLDKIEEKLAPIIAQYDAFTLAYYKGVGCAVYYEDGTLNIEESAINAAAKFGEDKVKNADASSCGQEAYNLGRGLLEKIVTLKLEEDGCTNISIGKSKDYAEGTSLTGKDVWDVQINEEGVETTVKKSKDQQWENISGQSGRRNHVAVSYDKTVTDPETGESKTERETKYFNYIVKDGYVDGVGITGNEIGTLEDGVIFVSEITKKYDDNGNFVEWVYERYDQNSTKYYDNYGMLTSDLQKAKEEVNAAKAKATSLRETVEKIGEAATGENGYENILNALDKAEEAVKISQANVDVLNDLIDNWPEKETDEEQTDQENNTNPTVDPVVDDETPSSPEAAETAETTETPSSPVQTIFEDDEIVVTIPDVAEDTDNGPTLPDFSSLFAATDDSSSDDVDAGPAPIVTTAAAEVFDTFAPVADTTGVTADATEGSAEATGSGVLGVRVDENSTGAGQEITGDGQIEEDGQAEEVKGTDEAPVQKKTVAAQTNKKQANKKGVRVEDPETPLAQLPNVEDGVEMSWWWLLVIALLGALGKRMYDKHKERVEAREAAKNNIDQ